MVMKLPEDFVYLKEINPNIIADLQFLLHENFVGSRIKGYHSNEVILTRPAAEALSKAQEQCEIDGYSLVVYDAYRPLKAVNFITEWIKDPYDDFQKKKYYPNISKHDIFELGFFSKKSGHSRGSTVDITIIKLGNHVKRSRWFSRKLLNDKEILYRDDDTIDMGTGYNLLDKASYHNSKLVSHEYVERRSYLKKIMNLHGFYDYHDEWWHYTLVDEPFPNSYFDFNVEI
uniref:D-Ala-D-Ala dipeptidase n=1 Tax=Acrobeloides nanus TaxID=290746 RepID=A0A914DH91_9BILA